MLTSLYMIGATFHSLNQRMINFEFSVYDRLSNIFKITSIRKPLGKKL